MIVCNCRKFLIANLFATNVPAWVLAKFNLNWVLLPNAANAKVVHAMLWHSAAQVAL